MKKLNRSCLDNYQIFPEKILQIGEGNFLRAFFDWMVDIMNINVDFKSSVVVVQPIEKGLIQELNNQDGLYTLFLLGFDNGKPKKQSKIINVISRGIDPFQDYNAYLEAAINPDLRFIVSNTTDAGIALTDTDHFDDQPPKSFPAKLTVFLFNRYRHFKGDPEKGLIFLPCELIDSNGDLLKQYILTLADRWHLEEQFKDWLQSSNIFCNTLVDRIVPGYPKDNAFEIEQELGYQDQLLVEGELFHLWVIEGPKEIEQEFPVSKAGLNVKIVDDLTPYRVRKVRILNGAHTSMVPVAYLYGLETVGASVNDPVVGEFIKKAIFEDIIPTIDLPENEKISFANETLNRFKNPYIIHRLMSIALNSLAKFKTRVLPSIIDYSERFSKLPENLTFAFAALIMFYKGKRQNETIELNDNESYIQFFKELWDQCDGSEQAIVNLVNSVLANNQIWDQDLTRIQGLREGVSRYLMAIQTKGIQTAIHDFLEQ